jgi:hypothetical protein
MPKSQLLEIRTFKSRIWKGRFTPNTIWLREGLSEKEKHEVMRHEFAHYWFYTSNRLGRFLCPLHKMQFLCPYATLVGLMLLFFPLLYLAVCFPLFIMNCHEIATSLRYGGKLSSTFAFIEIFGLACLLWVRLIL